MVAAEVSLSSIATSNSARRAYRWRIFEEMFGGVYVGPEIQYFGSDGYRYLPPQYTHHQHEDRRHRMVGRCGLVRRLATPRQSLPTAQRPETTLVERPAEPGDSDGHSHQHQDEHRDRIVT